VDLFDRYYTICKGLHVRFPGGDDPFRILARLMEESGELADQVHHFEGIGRKAKRAEAPDRVQLAKECQDVITAVLHIVMHYGVEAELAALAEKHYHQVLEEGLADRG